MGSGSGHNEFKIPDWRMYKIDGIKELEDVQNLLATKGLKDPWIRNEVWRYMPENYMPPHRAAFKSVFRGFRYGFAAFLATIAIEEVLRRRNPDPHSGHH
ncbi:NADH dehydrogenase [ubiquinone] 1 beta subcomplex subunit 3-like [Tubulanus polymorphus]|uniref:NADH dehydrogenase [ubiquinone] 1 beta subcomplex subunit 3-like n=1 Tax=Tubulanus polymorphus TaxID=672921 RepID=UPI003DA41EF2